MDTIQSFKAKDTLVLKDVPYQVYRVFPDKLQLENLQTSEIRETTVGTLLHQYVGGELQVSGAMRTHAAALAHSGAAPSEIESRPLGKAASAHTLRKVTWVVKLRDMGAFDFPKLLPEAISRVADEIRANSMITDKTVPHVSTIRRWVKQLEAAKKDVRGLFSRLDMRGGRGGSRLDPDVEACITEAVDSVFLAQKRSSAEEVLNAVKMAIDRLNKLRVASEQLPYPSLRTIQNRLSKLYAFDVCVARHGDREAERRFGDSVAARLVSRILQVVEIDHTPVDLWVVDAAGNILDRPYITVVLDRYSRAVLGFFLSLSGHGVESVFGAIRHALMPKTYLKERYPEIRGDWPCFGWFEKLLADNGSEFAGWSMVEAMHDIGIVLEFCAAYQPNGKPFVERFLRTFNHGFIHRLKGTSLARVHERKGEDLQADACIPLEELERLIHIWIVDVYHSRPHSGLRGRTPSAVWAEGACLHPPQLKLNAEAVDIALAEVEERSLGRSGIEINNHKYSDERLCALRRMLPANSKVKVKHRKFDLGHIFVLDPFTNEYVRVDNVKDGFAGVSVEQDRMLVATQKQSDPDDARRIAPAEEIIRTKVKELADSRSAKDRKIATKATRQNSGRIRASAPAAAPKRAAKPELPMDAFDELPALLEEA